MHFNNPEAKERIKWSTQVYSTFHGRAAIQFILLMVEEKVFQAATIQRDVKNTNKQTSYKMIELLIMYWIGEVCTYKTKASHREFYNELQYVKYVYGAIIA